MMMMMLWAMGHLEPPEAERGQKDAPKSSHPGAVRAVFQYVAKDKVSREKHLSGGLGRPCFVSVVLDMHFWPLELGERMAYTI